MIIIDNADVKRYIADLKMFKARALPFATKNTINTAAFETRKEYQSNIRKSLILRNKWSEASVRAVPAKTLDISKQESIVGSIASYMSTQEFGGTVRGGGKSKPIPTSYSAGQSGKPRTALPKRPNQLKNIKLRKMLTRTATTKKQRMLFDVQNAVLAGSRYVYLELIGKKKKRGIFKVVGGSKRFNRGWPRGAEIKMVWDMSQDSVDVPKTPLLGPATDLIVKNIPDYYARDVLYQLKRNRILGYR